MYKRQALFIHTQIVDVKRFHIRENIVTHVLLKHAESVAQYMALFIRSHKHRSVAVSYTHLDVYKRQLLENGIKYGREGGWLRLTLTGDDETVVGLSLIHICF